ncbi:nitroreductase family deazaflavin-dependent oxidoreductase [Streptomyces sp. NPDC093221]|uniref:nitroreductase family deazaflavin-dependent oxidoreductase n=1 Tax=Streptomyces sp. NPDC093221 TaxID=3366032 RepID=UPI00381933E0
MSDGDDFNARITAEFRASHGKVGGPFEGAPMVLLHTRGARTGIERVNPLMYMADGDRYLVFASKGGADTHPAWYLNLLAHPDIDIEIGDETIPVHAEELKGAERDEKYAEQASRFPGFADYQKKTSRVIPVIALSRR